MIEIFDIEIYPNYFLLNTIMYETKEKKSFVIDEHNNDLREIVKWIKEKNTRVGHNIIQFDNMLLCYLQQNEKQLQYDDNLEIVRKLKRICDKIINRERNSPWEEELKELFKIKYFNYIDTYAIMNTVDRVSLKQASINMFFHNVQELPYSPNTVLNEQEKQIVKEYCFNDCEISCLLYERKIPDLELRKDVSARYGLEVTNANDTLIAKKILDKYYSEQTGIDIKAFKDLRSYNKPFLLKEILPIFEFKTKQFQELYEWFKVQEITEKIKVDIVEKEEEEIKKEKISYTVKFPNLNITFALGGVHSDDEPGKFVTTENNIIKDCDFSSYYPNLILNYKIKPRHVKKEFLDILKTLTLERIEDKKAGRKKDANIKKIVINSIYGLLGSDYYWLKDTKALLKTTISGQLWLAKFCEDLLLAGIEVISLNTDGILCNVKKEQLELYYKICNNISEQVGIEVEFTDYKQYIRRDVNNYLSITSKETKQKGKYFTTEVALNKGLYYPIIGKALNNWYINNISIEKTINEEKNTYLFMASQKIDLKKFSPELHYYDKNFKLIKEPLQKFNRWLVTNKGGKFLKIEKDEAKAERLKEKEKKKKKITQADLKNKVIGIETDYFVTIVNKFDSTKDYNINKKFYIDLCYKTINLINPIYIQTSLF